jgi:hypothetical protein
MAGASRSGTERAEAELRHWKRASFAETAPVEPFRIRPTGYATAAANEV